MTILINPYTSISPYLYSFWFHDPLVSNHLKITVQFIIGLCFRHIISADGAVRIAIKIWILHNNNYNAIPIPKKKNILEKENWHKVKKVLKYLKHFGGQMKQSDTILECWFNNWPAKTPRGSLATPFFFKSHIKNFISSYITLNCWIFSAKTNESIWHDHVKQFPLLLLLEVFVTSTSKRSTRYTGNNLESVQLKSEITDSHKGQTNVFL